MWQIWLDELRGSRFWAALSELFGDNVHRQAVRALHRWFFEE